MHFSEIIKLQFRKKSHTLRYILALFRDITAQLSLRNAWLPPIFFSDSNSPCLDLLFPHSHKPHKNTSVLVGTILKISKLRDNKMSPCIFLNTYQAVTKFYHG